MNDIDDVLQGGQNGLHAAEIDFKDVEIGGGFRMRGEVGGAFRCVAAQKGMDDVIAIEEIVGDLGADEAGDAGDCDADLRHLWGREWAGFEHLWL